VLPAQLHGRVTEPVHWVLGTLAVLASLCTLTSVTAGSPQPSATIPQATDAARPNTLIIVPVYTLQAITVYDVRDLSP
jgi:hypothetical protein